jgi:hypothetical protein
MAFSRGMFLIQQLLEKNKAPQNPCCSGVLYILPPVYFYKVFGRAPPEGLRVFGTTPSKGLLRRSWSHFERTIVYGSSKTAPTPLFSPKNGSSYETFGRAPPEEPELAPGMSPTK